MADQSSLRVSDGERDEAVERLSAASVDGRLTLGELTERTEAAYRATTRGELTEITGDLPPAGPPATPRPDRSWMVGVFGDLKRGGRWRLDREVGALAIFGDTVLDLRDVEAPTGAVDLLVVSVFGDIEVIVPPGVSVEVTGLAPFGDKVIEVGRPVPQAPLVRVRADTLFGDVRIVAA